MNNRKTKNHLDVILDCTGEAKKATKLLGTGDSLCSLVSYPTLESIRDHK